MGGSYNFENIDINGAGLTMAMVIWGIFAGIVAGILLIAYNRVYIGKIVRRLKSSAANSPESAKTLAELEIDSPLRRSALKDGAPLRKLVACANEEDYPYPQSRGAWASIRRMFSSCPNGRRRIDFSTAKFYMTDDCRYRAEVLYDSKGINAVTVAVAIGLLAALFVGVSFALPELLGLLDSFIGSVK